MFETEDDDILIVSNIAIISDFAVSLDNGSHNFGLKIMGLIRPLKDYSFRQPLNLAKEGSNLRE